MDDKLRNFFSGEASKYKKNAQTSVIYNNHMNDLEDTDVITQDKIDSIIDSFISKVSGIQDISVDGEKLIESGVLEFLTNQAVKETPDRESDAILVDFINFVGVNHRVDYALYTRNLDEERFGIFADLVTEEGIIYMNPDALEAFKSIGGKMGFGFNSPASIILEAIADELLPHLTMNSKSTTQKFIDFYYSIEDLSLRKGEMESSKLESVRPYIGNFRGIYPSILGKLFGPEIQSEACEILGARVTDVYQKQAIRAFQELS